MFEFKYSKTVDGKQWSDSKASEETLEAAVEILRGNMNVRIVTEHAVLYEDGGYNVYESESMARAVALGKQVQFDMGDKATQHLTQAPVYAHRQVLIARNPWEVPSAPEKPEPDERCDFYSTDKITTARSRDDGWRCGRAKNHRGGHELLTSDGEAILFSDGWEQR